MDVAYRQHANPDRRKNRSSTNLNHLSLAPLTSKWPLTDPDNLPDFAPAPPQRSVSYLQGKSAPATPRLLSQSPARGTSRTRRSSLPRVSDSKLPKSKSASYLATYGNGRYSNMGPLSPTTSRRKKEEFGLLSTYDRNDSDWLLRAGALLSSETRESKGQAWLVSRASSTSLAAPRDAEEEAYEWELARERALASRRGSITELEEGFMTPKSRFGSRSHSRMGSRSRMRTPMERTWQDGYFGEDYMQGEAIPGPDFVSLDEKLEAIEADTSQADEAAIRRLVKRENAGAGSWMGSLLGWSLFSVDENEEDSDNAEDDDEEADLEMGEGQLHKSPSQVHFDGTSAASEEPIPPPQANEGGWQDAAWLLSVASRVLL